MYRKNILFFFFFFGKLLEFIVKTALNTEPNAFLNFSLGRKMKRNWPDHLIIATDTHAHTLFLGSIVFVLHLTPMAAVQKTKKT